MVATSTKYHSSQHGVPKKHAPLEHHENKPKLSKLNLMFTRSLIVKRRNLNPAIPVILWIEIRRISSNPAGVNSSEKSANKRRDQSLIHSVIVSDMA